jgi:two-component system, response regulator PdtaR
MRLTMSGWRAPIQSIVGVLSVHRRHGNITEHDGPDGGCASFINLTANKARVICHVLIIEDETLVAMDLQSVLSAAGATSFAFAASEEEAIDQAFACCPLIITSDVRLVTGTGPAAVQVIRERLGMIPVLFISGTPNDCNPREPGDAVFGKPFDRKAIAAAFRTLLSSCRPSIVAPSETT